LDTTPQFRAYIIVSFECAWSSSYIYTALIKLKPETSISSEPFILHKCEICLQTWKQE